MAKQQHAARIHSTKDLETSWFQRLSGPKQEIVCLLFLYILLLVLFRQILFNNMMFADAGDTAAHEAVAEGIEHLKTVEGSDPLWVPFIFSGMPVFGFFMLPHHVGYLKTALELVGRPLFFFADWGWMVFYMFLAGSLMFMLIRKLGMSHLPAVVGALIFMLNPYLVGLAEVGHGSKLATLSYVPLLFLSTYLVLEKKSLIWMGILATSVGTILLGRHPQIAFYGFLISGAFVVVHAIREMRTSPKSSLVKLALFAIPLLIGFCIAAYEYLPVQEYSHYSIRGGGGGGEAPAGLDYDYATNWSFHPYESINYIFPAFFAAGKYTMNVQGQEFPLYWGWMPFTDSTVYIGLLPILFGVIALLYRRNYITMFLAIFSGFMLVLSFGKHLPILYDLFFNYFPYFNRFRVPVMILHLMPFTVGLLGAFGLSYFMENAGVRSPEFKNLRKRLVILAAIIAALLVIGLLAKNPIRSSMMQSFFFKSEELARYGAQGVAVLKENRFDLFWGDFLRTSVLTLILIGVVILYLDNKIRRTILAASLVLFTVVDLSIHSTKYINPRSTDSIDQEFAPDATIRFLQADTSLHRIFPVGQALFQNNSFMYHAISSIGGYSPAKLKIYQEMIDSSLYRWPDPAMPLNMNIINMLGGKYLVANGRLPEDRFKLVHEDQEKSILIYENAGFLPRAWFVDGVRVTRSKKELFGELNSPGFDPRRTALLEAMPGVMPGESDSSSVHISSYASGSITIDAYTDTTALLVLAEPYYPAGWTATVDGMEAEILKTNFVLRSIVVPPGAHRIEFRFDPPSYNRGYAISHIGWGLAFVLLAIGLYREEAVRKLLKR